MAISRLQAALGAVTNEITVAAAQINFDFTLVKNEAPKEYRLFGESLSKKRKDQAERGQIHRTARRLGALFDGVCPPTPNLVRAYGIRVSETSGMTKGNAPTDDASSMFSQYLGIDGTSIWAAATSSPSAIQVELLACMLARIFDAPECTSIWVELIKDRRQEIATKFDNKESVHYSILSAAAQAEITRTELAEWDSSARAWLRVADTAKIKEQKQLMLILDNLDLSVNEEIRVYPSVIAAWSSSLTIMESLVSGIPQAIENGAAIVGLSSWHIYPDMVVLGSRVSNLHMNDVLVASGGVITIGMQRPEQRYQQDRYRGIYWSLSLTHLRYYGHPVMKERQLNSRTSRVTFDEFCQAVLGCVLGTWEVPQSQIPVAVDVISAIEDALKRGLEASSEDSVGISKVLDAPHWFQMIAKAARQFIGSLGEDKDHIMKLIKLGQRRHHLFTSLSAPKPTSQLEHIDLDTFKIDESPSPFFGLKEPGTFVSCLRSNEDRLKYLRTFASKLQGVAATDLYIRFRWHNSYAFATAIPTSRNPFLQHERWFPLAFEESRVKAKQKAKTQKIVRRESFVPGDETGESRGSRFAIVQDHNHKSDSEDESGDETDESRGSRFAIVEDHNHESASEDEMSTKPPVISGERSNNLTESYLHDSYFFVQNCPNGGHKRFNFLFGDPFTTALFINEDIVPTECPALEEIPFEDLLYYLRADMVSISTHTHSLIPIINDATTDYLRALSSANLIYMELPGATLDILVLDRPIMWTQWANRILSSEHSPRCERETAIACITYFETGKIDLAPNQLKDVFAMSSGDSMYIAEQLLCDPWVNAPPDKFRRVLGNVGRSGVTMLIAPKHPMVKKIDPEAWKFINNAMFNNREEDHFSRTSTHLSFTEYYRPLDLSERGEQDIRVAILESVVSVYDGGRWVADLDILAAMESMDLHRITTKESRCEFHGVGTHAEEVISLENWDEVLDLPTVTSVVSARGNPLARLAIATVMVQLRSSGEFHRKIAVCPPGGEICIFCIAKTEEFRHSVLIY